MQKKWGNNAKIKDNEQKTLFTKSLTFILILYFPPHPLLPLSEKYTPMRTASIYFYLVWISPNNWKVPPEPESAFLKKKLFCTLSWTLIWNENVQLLICSKIIKLEITFTSADFHLMWRGWIAWNSSERTDTFLLEFCNNIKPNIRI